MDDDDGIQSGYYHDHEDDPNYDPDPDQEPDPPEIELPYDDDYEEKKDIIKMMMNEKKQLEQFREQSEDFKKNLPNNFKFINELNDEEKSEIFTKHLRYSKLSETEGPFHIDIEIKINEIISELDELDKLTYPRNLSKLTNLQTECENLIKNPPVDEHEENMKLIQKLLDETDWPRDSSDSEKP